MDNEAALGLHPHGLENIRGGIGKVLINISIQPNNNIHGLLLVSMLKPRDNYKNSGNLLSRGQTIQYPRLVSTMFNPLVKCFTVFKHLVG